MFKTGDILVCEFGYNCRLVNFYEVVGVTKSGQSVRIRNLKEKFVSHDGYGQNGYVVPNLEGPTKPIKGTFRVDEGKYFGEYCKISGCYATLWDGNPEAFYTD